MKFIAPVLLQGLHWLLDGFDVLHQLWGGFVGDILSLFLRDSKVAIDVLQLVLAVADVFAIVGKLKAAGTGLKGLLTLLHAAFAKEPGEAIRNAFSDTVALGGFSIDIATDLHDLNESVQAYADANK